MLLPPLALHISGGTDTHQLKVGMHECYSKEMPFFCYIYKISLCPCNTRTLLPTNSTSAQPELEHDTKRWSDPRKQKGGGSLGTFTLSA